MAGRKKWTMDQAEITTHKLNYDCKEDDGYSQVSSMEMMADGG